MATAFVPDWNPDWDSRIKARAPAPWGDNEGQVNWGTTTSAAYQANRQRPPAPIRPARDNGILMHAGGSSSGKPESTAQVSFMAPPANFAQLPSCKPKNTFQPEPWTAPLEVSSRVHYPSHAGVARTLPILPKSSRPVDNSKFAARATSQDSYQDFPPTYVRTQPIYPSRNLMNLGNDESGSYESTAKASYRAHAVQRYVPAKRPPPTLNSIA
jgi:hypothetical protein